MSKPYRIQLPPPKNIVDEIFQDLNHPRIDFRDRGAIVYKSHWDEHRMIQNDKNDSIIIDDAGLYSFFKNSIQQANMISHSVQS